MQLIKKIILGAALLGAAQFSFARCTEIKDFSTETVSVSFGKLTAPIDTGIGEVFATAKYKLNNSFYYKGCGGEKQYLIGRYESNGGLSGEYDTIPTGIEGIGIRISLDINGESNSFGPVQSNIIIYPTLYNNVKGSGLTLYGSSIKVELVKTADTIGGGPLRGLSGASGKLYLQGSQTPMVIVDLNGVTKEGIVNPSCSLDTPNGKDLTVPMPDVSLANFNGVGSTAGKTEIKFGLICSGGLEAEKVNVMAAFSPSNGSDNSDLRPLGVLDNAASGASASKGIGIQILKGGTPITFDKRYNLGPLGSADMRYWPILYASYYQYSQKPSAGKVEAYMVYNINYE